jgi:dethiobiotin synthetase
MTSKAETADRKIIFVTGTDTGVGKTLLAGLLLFHSRRTGCHALAMKPFCCGRMDDVRFLGALQDGELSAEEMCPFSFVEPVAPLVAARRHHREIALAEVLARIRKLARRCDRLIVEGCGGLLVPLGEDYTVEDLIRSLDCGVVVVARNKLGTINHTLLTVTTLQKMGVNRLQVAMMNVGRRDFSSSSNERILRRMLLPVRLFSIPWLGPNAVQARAVRTKYKKTKKTLARMMGTGIL